MASVQSIAPFPADIDCDAFGHYLAGFIDGEACFMLSTSYHHDRSNRCERQAVLTISLRADDVEILNLMRSYWQCGRMCRRKAYNHFREPQWTYQISSTPSLASVIVPHFDKYPLRAKKAQNYAVWREGVMILWDVFRRPKRRRRTGYGAAPKFLPDEEVRFDFLRKSLMEQRKYMAPPADLTRRHDRVIPSESGPFDHLLGTF